MIFVHFIDHAVRRVLILLISFYKFAISPLLGNNCRFNPTCSQYAIQLLNKTSCVSFVVLLSKRLIRCHPWNPGGNDPI